MHKLYYNAKLGDSGRSQPPRSLQINTIQHESVGEQEIYTQLSYNCHTIAHGCHSFATWPYEFHETCHSVTLYFMKKKTPNDAVTPHRQGQFTPKMKANAVPRLLSSLVWIDQYYECNGMTGFMEFTLSLISDSCLLSELSQFCSPFVCALETHKKANWKK